jgi:two-component system chemotaxis response regulator CheV
MKTNILLEAGTNELEIMVVEVGGLPFGVNVAKVREVVLPGRVHRLPHMPAGVEGVMMLRGMVVQLLDLGVCLGYGPVPHDPNAPMSSQILVTEFNARTLGFRVASIRKIERVSWDRIVPVPDTVANDNVPLVGVATIGNELVQMLDLEDILFRIDPRSGLDSSNVERRDDRLSRRIVVAEDSTLIRSKLVSTLRGAGYENITDFANGLDAWNHLSNLPADQSPDLLVTDIEMPQLDGLHLCRLVRAHPRLAKLPVVLFSSLVNSRTLNKGEQVGASAQINKPELARLVTLVDELLGLAPQAKRAA